MIQSGRQAGRQRTYLGQRGRAADGGGERGLREHGCVCSLVVCLSVCVRVRGRRVRSLPVVACQVVCRPGRPLHVSPGAQGQRGSRSIRPRPRHLRACCAPAVGYGGRLQRVWVPSPSPASAGGRRVGRINNPQADAPSSTSSKQQRKDLGVQGQRPTGLAALDPEKLQNPTMNKGAETSTQN